MPLTAAEPNPRKAFSFELEIEGVVMARVQKVKFPAIELTVAEHGNRNRTDKTASRRNVGDLELEKVMPADGQDRAIQDWMDLAERGVPTDYKRSGILRHFGPDDATVVGTWRIFGAWPKKDEMGDLDRKSDDNLIQKVTLSVDDIRQVA